MPQIGGTTKTDMSVGLTPEGGLPATTSGTVVPNQAALDTTLSGQIASLLSPGNLFPDTSRQAGELAAARGIPGSSAAYGTSLRMTDEEKLKRIALGEQLMSSMSGRNQANVISPYQQASLALQQQQLELAKQAEARAAEWQNFQRSLSFLTSGGSGGNTATSATPAGFYRNMYGQLVGSTTGQVGREFTRTGGGWGW